MQNQNELLNDLLITAIEGGGSNYWYFLENKSMQLPYYEVINSGDQLTISNRVIAENEQLKLIQADINLKSLHNALELLKINYPKHYGAVIEGNFDAADADLFLQLAVIGKVIYC